MPPDPPAADPSSSEVTALADALAADMRRRWGRGDRAVTEDYLAAHPVLRAHPGAAGELIYEEVSLRRERGEAGGSDEVLRRFPEWAGPLRVLLGLRRALENDGTPDYPEPGERLGEYRLLAELGRGRQGRVYLARQPALADRPVVLKLTPRADAEHVSLARLQHTHIVPLYAAHDDPGRRVRALCMPYFGRVTLAHAFAELAAVPPADRTPADLWAVLGPNAGAVPPSWAASDYPRLVAGVGACLADALQFAHDRHLLHLDVKPSNVLLTADGAPMLLDFHLARPPLAAGQPPPDRLGGTPGYMAPEQRAAFEAVRAGRPVPAAVDGRADVFALGVVLREALAGERPSERPRPLSERNPRVSPGLADVVARCLEPDPEGRYPSAASVADDLRLHLADRPLRGVRNRSLAERWRKWRRRRPHALGAAGVVALLLAAVGLSAGYVSHRRDAARAALDEGDAALARGRPAEAAGAYRRGLAVTDGLPVRGGLSDRLAAGLRRAELAAGADDLHAVAEGLRALAVADAVSPDDLARADRLGRGLWAKKAELVAAAAYLPAEARGRVRADLLDAALVWSHLRVRLAPAERAAAVAVLTEADTELGPCAGLYLERAALLRDLGRAADADVDLRRAAETPPATAWDHLAVGGHLARRGDHAAARAEFAAAVARDPRSFWARLLLGRADLALGRPADAVLEFAVCTGLDPANPLGLLHKALAHARLGQRDRALADVERALALDPTDAQARALRDAVTRLP